MLRMGLAPCAPFNVTNDLMVRPHAQQTQPCGVRNTAR